MKLKQMLTRLTIAALVLGGLSACTIVPAQPGAYGYGYRTTPVYVETYPTYRYGYPNTYYYGRDHRHYDNRDDRRYREERHYQEPRRIDSPLESAARAHRDVRRSLGLPRLPGMP
ncbi:hypothetical protein [Dechloromonas hortensis]|uniref:hypothetical protein n=1 Tax=Dechloromonas hortensis TaxID=337779 RepID=UPI001291A28D|nr:hypothetical protein [Dechloromonas hortensis]